MERSQSGNVLIYILVAVALLAALSYAIAVSGRGSIATLTAEKAGILATEIIEYGNVVFNATAQIRLRGYDADEISYENNIVAGYANANCTEDECKIYDVNGGGVQYIEPKAGWLDSAHSAQLRYGELYFHASASAVEVGTTADDLIMFIPYIKKELCVAINKKLGIEPTTDDVPSETHGPFAVNIKYSG